MALSLDEAENKHLVSREHAGGGGGGAVGVGTPPACDFWKIM